jgi:hypothetical protein
MKFATAALVACVSAGQVAFPSISWNNDKLGDIKGDVKAYGVRQQAAQKQDNEDNIKSLSHAYSSYKVGEYVIFGKYYKPIADDYVVFFEEQTVSGNCNKEVATQCVNSFILNGKYDDKHHDIMAQCVKGKAGCATDFDKLLPHQKEALAKKYETDVQNLSKAYKALFKRTGAELEVAQKEHEKRQEAMRQDFRKTAKQVAAKFGCDVKCLHECGEQNQGNCFEKCHCGKGVIKIQETYVNTFGIVKREYGDVQNLSKSETRNVNEAIQRF